MEEDFRALLLSDSDLAAVDGIQVVCGERKQGAGLPAVVLFVVGRNVLRTYQGPVDLEETQIQANCMAETYLGTKQLARKVKAAGGFKTGAYGATQFHGVFVDGENDLSPETILGAGVHDQMHVTAIDFLIKTAAEEA